jgi:hypothetical protein
MTSLGPAGRYGHKVATDGAGRMFMWGGLGNLAGSPTVGDYPLIGAVYDWTADAWTMMPETGAPRSRHGHSGVWTGSHFIVWGGVDDMGQRLNSGACLVP